jgi:hypothetical protein
MQMAARTGIKSSRRNARLEVESRGKKREEEEEEEDVKKKKSSNVHVHATRERWQEK